MPPPTEECIAQSRQEIYSAALQSCLSNCKLHPDHCHEHADAAVSVVELMQMRRDFVNCKHYRNASIRLVRLRVISECRKQETQQRRRGSSTLDVIVEGQQRREWTDDQVTWEEIPEFAWDKFKECLTTLPDLERRILEIALDKRIPIENWTEITRELENHPNIVRELGYDPNSLESEFEKIYQNVRKRLKRVIEQLLRCLKTETDNQKDLR